MSLRPATYEIALAKRQAQDARKSRLTPLKRGPGMRQRKPLRSKPDPKLVAWGRAIKKRDVFCQWPHCSRLGPAVTIDAHHKAPRSLRPDLKYELSNGIVLCRHHHNYTHGSGKPEAVALGFLIEETYELANRVAK